MEDESANPIMAYSGRYGDGMYDTKSAATQRHTVKPFTFSKGDRKPISEKEKFSDFNCLIYNTNSLKKLGTKFGSATRFPYENTRGNL